MRLFSKELILTVFCSFWEWVKKCKHIQWLRQPWQKSNLRYFLDRNHWRLSFLHSQKLLSQITFYLVCCLWRYFALQPKCRKLMPHFLLSKTWLIMSVLGYFWDVNLIWTKEADLSFLVFMCVPLCNHHCVSLALL